MSAVIAERFEELPALYPDRDDYRYLVANGVLVPAVTITAVPRRRNAASITHIMVGI